MTDRRQKTHRYNNDPGSQTWKQGRDELPTQLLVLTKNRHLADVPFVAADCKESKRQSAAATFSRYKKQMSTH